MEHKIVTVADLVGAIIAAMERRTYKPSVIKQYRIVWAKLSRHSGAMPVDAALDWLTSMEGVGPKTAALVLLFALGKPIMPVDTHIARVMTRLGMVPDRTGTVTNQRILTNLIGEDAATIYAVHVETIDHGRTICHARRPRCASCPLQDLCEYYTQHGA